MIEDVKKLVYEVLCKDDSGHGYDHVERVYNLAVKFAKKEQADVEVVALIALLHDVDDYKLFGKEQAEDLTNAKKIMKLVDINEEKQKNVLASLKTMGYSNCVKGIRPISLEGQIVSDADMCDAMGANGILRTHKFGIKYGREFFNNKSKPEGYIDENYGDKVADCSVQHMFEKLLKLKGLMLTSAGKEEASNRHQLMVDFLYELFEEEEAYEWKEYLDKYLENL
jgi:uncharacterized protein